MQGLVSSLQCLLTLNPQSGVENTWAQWKRRVSSMLVASTSLSFIFCSPRTDCKKITACNWDPTEVQCHPVLISWQDLSLITHLSSQAQYTFPVPWGRRFHWMSIIAYDLRDVILFLRQSLAVAVVLWKAHPFAPPPAQVTRPLCCPVNQCPDQMSFQLRKGKGSNAGHSTGVTMIWSPNKMDLLLPRNLGMTFLSSMHI